MSPKPELKSRHGIEAFSLLELMAVVAVMSILMALAVPSFTSITRSFAIISAGQEVRGAIALARQEATSRSRPVEVRFCRLTSGAPIRYVQLVVHEPNGTLRILSRAIKLAQNVYIDGDTTRSSLFGNSNAAQGATGAIFTANRNSLLTLPDVGSGYAVFSFFIRPDGTSNLPWSAASFPGVTLRADQNPEGAPQNYAIIQMDPANGRTTLLRP